MPTLAVLYSPFLAKEALEILKEEKSAVELAIENAFLLPECKKVLVLMAKKDESLLNEIAKKCCNKNLKVITLEKVTPFSIFQNCILEKDDATDVFISPLEAPFIDIEGAGELYGEHMKYKAEYTFAEGYPQFIFPEILNIGLCTILSSFCKDDFSFAKDDFIFNIVKKDINSYDIETKIAPEDVRMLKLKFIVQTKRDKLLCKAFSGINAKNYKEILSNAPLKLKTLPRYYMIEIAPKPLHTPIYKPNVKENDPIMSLENFAIIVEKISKFSNDAIISLSLYGDPLEHFEFIEIVKKALFYKNISLLIETHGTAEGIKETMQEVKNVLEKEELRPSLVSPLYWITFIDAISFKTYSTVYNVDEKEAERLLKKANETAEFSKTLFGKDAFVQIVRMNENEDDLEMFYRGWKDKGLEVIIQKYDYFCAMLPDRRVADLSPLKRMPCRHIAREMSITSSGDVLLCREDVKGSCIMGNALKEDLEQIWKRFDLPCTEQYNLKMGGLCELCDEYYTYNF